jgi:hypothetical protein
MKKQDKIKYALIFGGILLLAMFGEGLVELILKALGL